MKKNSGFSIKHKKKSTNYTYWGDLKIVIEKAKKELKDKKESNKRIYLLWNYEKAKKEHEKWEKRIIDLEEFIELAENELRKNEKKEE